MTKPLQVMSGEELMDMDYKPIKFAVREFLPQGLAILAGAPKTGKSFFALWLCLCVAKGEPVWDCETAKGTVLYLCLEDNQSRLQNRTLTITDDAPANLFFLLGNCSPWRRAGRTDSKVFIKAERNSAHCH